MVLYSLVTVEKSQPPTVQNTNEPVSDGLKMSHQLVGVWSEHPMFHEISSEESGRFFVKISRYTVFD